MIKKLSQRIFFLIMISLSIVILGIIILFASFNYTNTIKTSTLMLNRFMSTDPIRQNEEQGFYDFTIQNSKIIRTNDNSNNEIIKQYAIKLSKGNSENGIIGNYIYRVKKDKGRTSVTLMENENVVKHIKMIFIFTVVACFLSLIIIYIVARKISNFIVQPVQETFEKQKQFISDASHELKTPLAVIEANTDVLQNEFKNNKWLNYIQNEIESMNKLINELLLLAKTENVDEAKYYNELDISNETKIIVSMFESMAYEKNVVLKTNIQERITINGNKEDFEHLISTLLDNAIKHTRSSEEVIIVLQKDKNNMILQIKNMGEPIPESEREKIFERFYRIDKSRSRKEKRYGLGLAIAKATVEKYKGNIAVSYENGLTIFKVIIPIN